MVSKLKIFLKYILLISLFFYFFSFCNANPEQKKNFTTPQDTSLPNLSIIKTLVSKPENKSILQNKAIQLGYSSIVDWYANVLQKVSEEELDFYYNLYKSNSLPDPEIVSKIRKEIHERITWKKIFIESKIDYSQKDSNTSQMIGKFDLNLENSQFLGSKNPKVRIIEFSDFACYYCATSQAIKKKVLAKYKNEIQWSFKNFPLVEKHEDAFLAHIALGCVERVAPKKYWEYYFYLFENYKNLKSKNLLNYTEQLKIDASKWKACMNDKTQKEEIISKIENDIAEGKKLGVSGTPTFIIEKELYVGSMPFSSFEKIIQRHLKK